VHNTLESSHTLEWISVVDMLSSTCYENLSYMLKKLSMVDMLLCYFEDSNCVFVG